MVRARGCLRGEAFCVLRSVLGLRLPARVVEHAPAYGLD